MGPGVIINPESHSTSIKSPLFPQSQLPPPHCPQCATQHPEWRFPRKLIRDQTKIYQKPVLSRGVYLSMRKNKHPCPCPPSAVCNTTPWVALHPTNSTTCCCQTSQFHLQSQLHSIWMAFLCEKESIKIIHNKKKVQILSAACAKW